MYFESEEKSLCTCLTSFHIASTLDWIYIIYSFFFDQRRRRRRSCFFYSEDKLVENDNFFSRLSFDEISFHFQKDIQKDESRGTTPPALFLSLQIIKNVFGCVANLHFRVSYIK